MRVEPGRPLLKRRNAWFEERAMAHYRLYFFNDGGHIVRVENFEARDDESAITIATFQGLPPMELWCAERKVEQWHAIFPSARSK